MHHADVSNTLSSMCAT